MPEKIVTAYQSVLDEHLNEDRALSKCEASMLLIGKIAQDVDLHLIQGMDNFQIILLELIWLFDLTVKLDLFDILKVERCNFRNILLLVGLKCLCNTCRNCWLIFFSFVSPLTEDAYEF